MLGKFLIIAPSSKECIGCPTQKPLTLLEGIIRACSNEGDVVFDPFCGCATTLAAADRLSRDWVGIDISGRVAEIAVRRIEDQQGIWRETVARKDIPQRADLGGLREYHCRENKEFLYGRQGGCAGCGVHFEKCNLKVDHYMARISSGTDHIDNLQLLCGDCNRKKVHRGMEYLRSEWNMEQKKIEKMRG